MENKLQKTNDLSSHHDVGVRRRDWRRIIQRQRRGDRNCWSFRNPGFLLGGLVLFIVMNGLGRLVLDSDNVQGLSGIIKPFLGERTADFIDWLYWSLWMVNIIAEAVAAASFMQLWFPHVPSWYLC